MPTSPAPEPEPESVPESESEPAPEPELFDEILYAPDRDDLAPRPVVSYREDDEPDYLDRVDRHALARIPLVRRGTWHGEWAELDRTGLARLAAAEGPRPAGTRVELPAGWRDRWLAARPLVLRVLHPELLPDEAAALEDVAADAAELVDRLAEEGGLRSWLGECAELLEPDFHVKGKPASLADPERDLERVLLGWQAPPPGSGASPLAGTRGRTSAKGPGGKGGGAQRAGRSTAKGPARRVDDLWLKSGWLSTAESDASLRLRVSFGREGPDDASRDHLRHLLTAELAERLLPGAALLAEDPLLAATLDAVCGEPVFLTQHIGYWNAPDGGALLHHDAFDEDPLGRQLGVGYVQLSGATAWIAVSIDDLAERVREFAEFMGEGELAWVKAQLFPTLRTWQRFRKRVFDDRALRRELALPGCGSLGPLVNRGPEFTAFLADAGHAVVLRPGEALLLPNHGFAATALHSVFCASDEPGWALSAAIRAARPPAEPPAEARDRARRTGHATGDRRDASERGRRPDGAAERSPRPGGADRSGHGARPERRARDASGGSDGREGRRGAGEHRGDDRRERSGGGGRGGA